MLEWHMLENGMVVPVRGDGMNPVWRGKDWMWAIIVLSVVVSGSMACTFTLFNAHGEPVASVGPVASPGASTTGAPQVIALDDGAVERGATTTWPEPLTTPMPVEPVVAQATPQAMVVQPDATRSQGVPAEVDYQVIVDARDRLVSELYARVSPSVVHISARMLAVDYFWGVMPSEGTGSGFVYDTDGHIVTNNHVVESAESVLVTLADGTQLPADIVGIDPSNDLAVLHVDVDPEKLVAVEMGDADQLQVGQTAVAIGNPFGLDRTLTTGVISALGRPLQMDNNKVIFNVIQTDAAINPGNSGGPLLNTRGQLIGVNTSIRQDAEGIGFAVSVGTVKRVVPELIAHGRYPHPWLGMSGYIISAELAELLDLPVEQGILLARVYKGSPADSAGLLGAAREVYVGNQSLLVGGDILVGIDGHPIDDWSTLQQYMEENTRVGQQVQLTVQRGQQQLNLTATLAAQP